MNPRKILSVIISIMIVFTSVINVTALEGDFIGTDIGNNIILNAEELQEGEVIDESQDKLNDSLIDNNVSDSSTVDDSTADDSTADDSTADDSTADDSTADGSTADDSTADDSTADDSTADDSTADDSTADDSTADGSTSDDSTSDDSTADDSTSDDSTAGDNTISKDEADGKNNSEADTASPSNALSGAETDSVYFIFNPDTNTITGYTSATDAPRDIVIPQMINGVEVLHIGDNAFSGQQLTSVTLNSNLQTIGASAFYNNYITSIEVPDTVTKVGDSAFGGCKNLISAVIGSGLDSSASASAGDILK